ncbi:E3 ubiquitin-protein ligase ATL6-like [Prosopis cineraria]|uniref:E3 ubiquitin-protein ligase ATL6-like n=1 Tax=Prosopis cineraria TaxID=364024 RepID=UPI00240FB1D8|nr:E3 ubiquitin-protein ligase ATL6-like [Prosopis cineraria]
MISRITHIHVLVFFLLLSAVVHAQSSSPPVASPKVTPHNLVYPSFDPVVVAFICFFLFISCCSIYLRHCSTINLAAGNLTPTTTNCSSNDPQGVDPKLLDTFPIFLYSAVKHLKFGKAPLECAVCLSEFNHQDTLRLLPKCNHVFHPQCIDAWLASHVTCPVCRSRLMPAEEEHHGGENEVVIVIPNDVNAHQVFDECSVSRTELNSGNGKCLGRCHSTGHSLGLREIGGKDTKRYTILMSENHGGMRRSASYEVPRGPPGEESSREHLIVPPHFTDHPDLKLQHCTLQIL